MAFGFGGMHFYPHLLCVPLYDARNVYFTAPAPALKLEALLLLLQRLFVQIAGNATVEVCWLGVEREGGCGAEGKVESRSRVCADDREKLVFRDTGAKAGM